MAAILAATWLATKIIGNMISKALGLVSANIALQMRRVISVIIWMVGIIAALDQIGLNVALLLMITAMAGVAAIAAYRDIFPNMASYDLIATYNPFKIGDWIEVEEHSGRVVDIIWMNTVLLTNDNEMIYIPNSKIITNSLVKRTVPGGIRVSVPFILNKSMDLLDVERIMLKVGAEMDELLIPGSNPEVHVINMEEKTVKVELLLKIINPAREEYLASEIRKRVFNILKEVEGNPSKNI